jgi:hypothetical protein
MAERSNTSIDAVEEWDIDKLVDYARTAAKALKRTRTKQQS